MSAKLAANDDDADGSTVLADAVAGLVVVVATR